MKRFIAIIQSGALAAGTFFALNTPAYARPDCQAVAESIKELESSLSDAWAAKNTGGQEELARTYASGAIAAYNNIDGDDERTCLNPDGRIRLAALASKGNALNAALALTTAAVRRAITAERNILQMGMPYRNVNPIYWRAMNADMAKMQRRYNDVARAEATAANAKRQATLSVTHAHSSQAEATRLTTMDAKPAKPLSKPSKVRTDSTIAPCARPNVSATSLHPAEPATPPMAQQQGIQGTVQVVVSLNAQSEVVGTRIQTSPSAILNSAALAAARQSTFQTEILNCKPIAADYIFSVDFTSP
jgi:TonB family protein